MQKVLTIFFVCLLFGCVVGPFYWGSIPFSENEMSELNGQMTARQAILKCENDLECAGFTFHGSFLEMDRLKHNIFFFRFVPGIYQNDATLFDWTSYLVDRQFAVYKGQVPEGLGRNNYKLLKAGSTHLTKRAEDFCSKDFPNCSALSLSNSGQMKAFDMIDLRSWVRDPDWTTIFNLKSNHSHVRKVEDFENVDFCCPLEIPYYQIDPDDDIVDSIQRISCNVTRDEFIEKYVRTQTPVIIEGCPYHQFDEYDLSVEAVTKMFHDNSTKVDKSECRVPLTGFTHTYTPNDFKINDDDVMEQLAYDEIRTFDRVRENCECDQRPESSCKIFETISKPELIPEDLYHLTKFGHEYAWIITSSEGTGSHPHVDPDLTGAWNYLLNGYKYWVIFPEGVLMRHVECLESCSPHIDEDTRQTWRWFQHVLPQLRNVKMYGQRLQEGIQGPGDAIFLPHGHVHSVLNIRDNVAVTENHLFVEGLPDLAKMIALDEISQWRPNWDEMAWKKIYYGGSASKEDRMRMRTTYSQVLQKLERDPTICDELEISRQERWKKKFESGKRHKIGSTYG